jgi:uncharacterized protein YutE (UPF0331/DUF86 family)
MAGDVIFNKSQVIERCIARVHEEYGNNPENLKNYTKQDSIILNIQRACEAGIDLAMHIVSERELGIPQNSRNAFDLLCENGVIDPVLSERMKAMVGFRNIAVHDYQNINLNILKQIIEKHLNDLKRFSALMLKS